MNPALIGVGGFVLALVLLSWWLRRRDRDGYPSRASEGEEHHPEPGVHYRPLEVPPEDPFD